MESIDDHVSWICGACVRVCGPLFNQLAPIFISYSGESLVSILWNSTNNFTLESFVVSSFNLLFFLYLIFPSLWCNWAIFSTKWALFSLLEMPIIAHQFRNSSHSIQFDVNCSSKFKRKIVHKISILKGKGAYNDNHRVSIEYKIDANWWWLSSLF